MADNTRLNEGSGGDLFAADELATMNGQPAEAGLKVQQVKVGFGYNGELYDVDPDAPLPVAAYGELIESIEALRMAVQSLTRSVGQSMPDTAGRLRVLVDSITASLTLSTVTTLSNQTSVGGYSGTEQIPSLMRLGADALRRNITVS